MEKGLFMKQQIKFITVCISFLFLLSACGGGGGGSTEESTTATVTEQPEAVEDTQPVREIESAEASQGDLRIIDASGVSGLDVLCGSQKITTQQDGAFSCETVPFRIYLGETLLGTIDTIPSDKRIYTQDILQEPRAAIMDPLVTKLSMVFQSLDSDGDPFNGITLLKANIEIFSQYLATYSSLKDIDVEDLAIVLEDTLGAIKEENKDAKVEFVDAKSAQYNLTAEMAKAPSLTYEERIVRK